METKHFHRRNLPHLYYNEGKYFITFRLVDSLPLEFLERIHKEFNNSIDELSIKEKKIFKKYDELLNKAYKGDKYLSIPEVAEIVRRTIQYEDDRDVKVICYCIMPNHVHLVFELMKNNRGISKIMQSIKRVSSKRSNEFLKRTGKFWQDESFDRWIRDDKELFNIINYVLENPVNAGLVDDWRKWQYTYIRKGYL
ncbi:MAG: transposase [Bacteroidetes bacterium]|nr:transposase [Bacteroidota bacterium]MCL6099701.1 transposase [Bacteroidota bacterium]